MHRCTFNCWIAQRHSHSRYWTGNLSIWGRDLSCTRPFLLLFAPHINISQIGSRSSLSIVSPVLSIFASGWSRSQDVLMVRVLALYHNGQSDISGLMISADYLRYRKRWPFFCRRSSLSKPRQSLPCLFTSHSLKEVRIINLESSIVSHCTLKSSLQVSRQMQHRVARLPPVGLSFSFLIGKLSASN